MPSKRKPASDDESWPEKASEEETETVVVEKKKKKSAKAPTPAKPPAQKKRKAEREEGDEEMGENGVKVHVNDEGEKYIDLGKKKRLTVRQFQGRALIDIREFYEDKSSGEMKPGKKGISLMPDQWEELKKSITLVDQLVTKLK